MPIWDSGVMGGGLACYATMLVGVEDVPLGVRGLPPHLPPPLPFLSPPSFLVLLAFVLVLVLLLLHRKFCLP